MPYGKSKSGNSGSGGPKVTKAPRKHAGMGKPGSAKSHYKKRSGGRAPK